MLIAPDIDPVAIQLGPVKIHWYGLMYLVGFAGGWALGVYRAKRPGSGWHPNEVADLLFYVALGVILGRRLGYVLFYNFGHYLRHPLEIFYIWTGGMSFHGGLVGVAVAMWLYARRTRRHWLAVTDFLAPLVPIGLGAGRIGNFINQELWGRVTDVPWGMVFRDAGPLHGIRRSSTSSRSKAWSCSRSSGSTPPGRVRPARCRGSFSSPTARSDSSWSSCACPMRTSGISPSTGSRWVSS